MTTFDALRRPLEWVFEPQGVVAGLAALMLLAFCALLPVPRADGQLIGSDGVGYYVYVRSLVIDGDLNFANEYATFAGAFKAPPPTPVGLPGNKLAVGPALLWLPFFLVAHAVALLGHALGAGVQADGYGYLYQGAISVGSIVYGAIGFWLALGSAQRLFGPLAATGAVVALWLAGNGIYYMVFEPSMSHMVALFAVSLLLSHWLRAFGAIGTPSLPQSAQSQIFFALRPLGALRFNPSSPAPGLAAFVLLGVAGGLVLLVRVQDGIFLLLPYGYLLLCWLGALGANDRAASGRWLLGGVVTAACTVAVFVPQIVVWRQLYGAWLTSPYASDHDPAFFWLQPQIGAVLFSTFHGLFSWHPIYLLALVGLLVGRGRLGWLSWALLGTLALNIYLVAAWWAWWQGDSFGGRMFLSATWIWVVGLAGLLAWLAERRGLLRVALAVALLLIGWNGLALVQYRLGFVPMGQPLTWREMTVERLLLPWSLLERLLR